MVSDRDIERFMRKVQKVDGGCWQWLGGKKGGGYGVFYLNGKYRGAHRVSLLLFKQLDIATDLDAMHSCDNPACVNPDHLKYGTRTENMRDAASKGRTVRVQDWRGERNPKAKLSTLATEEIVRMVRLGSSRAEAASKFQISRVRVSQILKEAGTESALSMIEAARQKRQRQTHCKRGHPLAGENLRLNTGGGRVCITCSRNAQNERRAARRKSL